MIILLKVFLCDLIAVDDLAPIHSNGTHQPTTLPSLIQLVRSTESLTLYS